MEPLATGLLVGDQKTLPYTDEPVSISTHRSADEKNGRKPSRAYTRLPPSIAVDEQGVPINYIKARNFPAGFVNTDYLNLLRVIYGDPSLGWDTPICFYPFGNDVYNHVSIFSDVTNPPNRPKQFFRTFENTAAGTAEVRQRKCLQMTGQLIPHLANRRRLAHHICCLLHIAANNSMWVRKDDAPPPVKGLLAEPPWLAMVPYSDCKSEPEASRMWKELLTCGAVTPRMCLHMHTTAVCVPHSKIVSMSVGGLLRAVVEVYGIGPSDMSDAGSNRRMIECGFSAVSMVHNNEMKAPDFFSLSLTITNGRRAGFMATNGNAPRVRVNNSYRYYYAPEKRMHFMPLLWAHNRWLVSVLHGVATFVHSKPFDAKLVDADPDSLIACAIAGDLYPGDSNMVSLQTLVASAADLQLSDDPARNARYAEHSMLYTFDRDVQRQRKRRRAPGEQEDHDTALHGRTDKAPLIKRRRLNDGEILAVAPASAVCGATNYWLPFRSHARFVLAGTFAPFELVADSNADIKIPTGVAPIARPNGYLAGSLKSPSLVRVTSTPGFVFDQRRFPFAAVFAVPIASTGVQDAALQDASFASLVELLNSNLPIPEAVRVEDQPPQASCQADEEMMAPVVVATPQQVLYRLTQPFVDQIVTAAEWEDVNGVLPDLVFFSSFSADCTTPLYTPPLVSASAALMTAFRILPLLRATVNGSGFPQNTPVCTMVAHRDFVPRAPVSLFRELALIVPTRSINEAVAQAIYADVDVLWRLALPVDIQPGKSVEIATYFEIYFLALELGWQPRRILRALYQLFCREMRGDVRLDARVPHLFEENSWAYDCMLQVLAVQRGIAVFLIEKHMDDVGMFALITDTCWNKENRRRLYETSAAGFSHPINDVEEMIRVVTVATSSAASDDPRVVAMREDRRCRATVALVNFYQRYIIKPARARLLTTTTTQATSSSDNHLMNLTQSFRSLCASVGEQTARELWLRAAQ